ncbi:MAG TPA: bacillithiol biosynthesis cysteine-adding enzyme BshC [Vicinamibacterales bacterium]|nr:bacillithiol biosynthesis cysteine-adding enzyme BshC [Vicinamibacterales bacterium]
MLPRVDRLPNGLQEYGRVQPSSDTAASTRLDIDVGRTPWVRRLAGEYADRFDAVAEFYAGNPWTPDGWRDAIRRVQAQGRDRGPIADVLDAQAVRRAAPSAAREAIRQLRDPRAVAVVTGQQAGLFGGPLYTLLKAITALQLAARARRDHAVPAVAIFWVDSEDHDWEEVRSCPVLDEELALRSVSLGQPDGAGELPVARIVLDDDIGRALSELSAALQPTEFTAEVIAALKDAYRPGVRMADAFASWMDRLLGPRGLVVFESADPAAKRFVPNVFARELAEPGHTASLALAAGEAMRARGHDPQVVPQADAVSLFRLNGGRKPVRARDGQFLVEDRVIPPAALVAEAREHPDRFSPNVLLRPIVQDTLFPTVAYVSGPSELAYLGQLKQLYAHFDVPMPLMYPRASATLLDSASTRFLSRYGLPFEELRPQDEAALNRLLEAKLPASVEQALHAADAAVREQMAHVVEEVGKIDPTLGGAARTTLGRMEHDLRTLHNKIIHAAKRRDETLRRQFSRAQALAFPGGHPQERTLGLPWFFNRYGWALIERLEAELPLETGKHYVLTL